MWTIALRRGGRLIALAPHFIFVHPESGKRRVLFLGTPVADYSDLLVESPYRTVATRLILEHLAANHSRWDFLDFQQLQAGSPLLEADPPSGLTSQTSVQEVCPVLHFHASNSAAGGAAEEALKEVVPSRMLERLGCYRRRLEKRGLVILEQARLDTFSELFDRFLELHEARWRGRGQKGVLFDQHLQEFHRESAYRFLRSGLLRLYAIRSNCRIIAAIYGFADRRHSYYYLSGFDPEFRSFSPGTLMIGCAIEEAVAEGCLTFDFLRGREPYKFMWGAKPQHNYRRQFGPAC